VRSRLARLSVVGALVLSVAACANEEPGQATSDPGAEQTSTDGEPPPSSETSGQELPPRPRDLSVTGLDPCTLFTDAQRAELMVDSVATDDAGGNEVFEGMQECVLEREQSEPFVSYTMIAMTTTDVSFWLEHNAAATVFDVGGFPAVEFRARGAEEADCAVAVGVAEGQHLHFDMLAISEDLTGDELCQRNTQVAEMAVATLQTLR
jgi:hypothetical protein